jgi:hypothetical protein
MSEKLVNPIASQLLKLVSEVERAPGKISPSFALVVERLKELALSPPSAPARINPKPGGKAHGAAE